jgi:hypothetical protein
VKAAYRLLNEPDVTYTALSEPHWQATRQQAGQADIVLFVQDTSDLDCTAHHQTKGLGWTGNTGGRGFLAPLSSRAAHCRSRDPGFSGPAGLDTA